MRCEAGRRRGWSALVALSVVGCAPETPDTLEVPGPAVDEAGDPHTLPWEEEVDCPEPPGAQEHALLGALRAVPCGTQTVACSGWGSQVPRWVRDMWTSDDEGSEVMRGCAPGGEVVDRSEPAFRVSLTRNLWMMRSEVTQEMWIEVFGSNPSAFGGEGEPPAWPDDAPGDPVAPSCEEDCPVESVTWWEALAFANAVSERDGLAPCYRLVGCEGEEGSPDGAPLVCEGVEVAAPGRDPYACEGWRLPLRVEWERAAMGGQDHLFSGSDDPNAVAWLQGPRFYREWSRVPEDLARIFGPQRVCTLEPNGYDLCDLSGNVEEWVWGGLSWLSVPGGGDMGFPVGAHHVDPRPAARPSGVVGTIAGGSWDIPSFDSLAITRKTRVRGADRAADIGFRLVRSVD